MKVRKSTSIPLAIVAVTVLGVGVGRFVAPAAAQDESGTGTTIAVKANDTLIDAPFEESLLKHFQKRFFNRIDATNEQRTKLSAIFSKRMEESRPLREQMRHELLAMSDLMAKDDTGTDQIKAQQQVIRGLRDQLADGRMDTLLKIRAVLTGEQRQKINDRIHELLAGDFKGHRLTGFAPPVRALIGQMLTANE